MFVGGGDLSYSVCGLDLVTNLSNEKCTVL